MKHNSVLVIGRIAGETDRCWTICENATEKDAVSKFQNMIKGDWVDFDPNNDLEIESIFCSDSKLNCLHQLGK